MSPPSGAATGPDGARRAPARLASPAGERLLALVPPLLALVAGGLAVLLLPSSGPLPWAAALGLGTVAALGSLHRPLGGASLGAGAAALPPALLLLPAPAVAALAAGALGAAGGLERLLRRRLAGARPERRGALRRLEEAGRVALAALAAAIAWTLVRGDAPAAEPALATAIAAGLYLVVLLALLEADRRLRSTGRRPAPPLGRRLAPLGVDALGWLYGWSAAVAWLAAGPAVAALLLGLWALAAAEAARNALAGRVTLRRLADLRRVGRAGWRMEASGLPSARLAGRLYAECRRVLPCQWFAVELADGGRWSAGPDGELVEGEAQPPAAPPPVPGLHRRARWRIVERDLYDLESGGRRLASLTFWCDPRRMSGGEEELLGNLLPQLTGWVERAELDREVRHDPLTGVATRRVAERELAAAFERAGRDGTPVAVVLADVDRFKAVNDGHGHAAGDRVLSAVARTLEAGRRSGDVCARYGGEEFLILLAETPGEAALAIAERLRRAVAALAVELEPGEPPLAVTASFGVAAFPELWTKGPDELVALADEALYQAKGRGRDRALLHLGRGRFRTADGEVVGDATGPPPEPQAPRLFA